MQRLLRLLVRTGDFAGALRAFNGLQRILEAEFHAKPSAETARLAADIRVQLAPPKGLNVPVLPAARRSEADRRAIV